MQIEYRLQKPDLGDLQNLYLSTGWYENYPLSQSVLAQALQNSQYYVSAYDSKVLVGFGRVLTDGVLHAMIYEMIVLPEYQGKGIGTQIIQRLVDWCNKTGIRDIQLFCARGKRTFYEKNGFFVRADDAPGMQYSGKHENQH
jgi:GNAT superfamily N-acetyltransferase